MGDGPPVARWHKSSYSSGDTGACLETRITSDGLIAVRDSKNPGPATIVSAGAWAAFVEHLKGEVCALPSQENPIARRGI